MNAFNFIDEETLGRIISYYKRLIISLNMLKKVQNQSSKWASKSSDEAISVSRTPPVRPDMNTAAAGGKKVKRVNVESGYKRRSFKLSFIFLIFQFVSVVLSYFIVVKDFMLETKSLQLLNDIKGIHSIMLLFQFDLYTLTVNLKVNLELPAQE